MGSAESLVVIARQLMRAIRGKRSQIAFSRRLGFRSNVAAKWEAGERMPTAIEALRYGGRSGIDVSRALVAFHPPTAALLAELDDASLANWLRALRGSRAMSDVAVRAGLSRFRVARFVTGASRPRLPEFLALVGALTDRLPDFVHAWVGIDRVPALRQSHERVEAARVAVFEQPHCLAVLCLLDTQPIAALSDGGQQVAQIARTLGRSRKFVQRCIDTLLRGGIVRQNRSGYEPTGTLTIDTGADPEQERAIRLYWARVARARIAAPLPGDLFSHNVFSIGRDDYAKLCQLQREFYRGVRALVAASQPTDVAALLTVHLMSWDADDTSIVTASGSGRG
jgi:DNA-binding phage protein